MIRTDRLLIRRVCTEDWKAVREIWADASRSVYARYDRPNDLDDRSVFRRIERWASFKDSDEHRFFAVCLQGSVIGYAALNKRENEYYELGYCFHSAYHGKGYAKESISAIIDAVKDEGAAGITAGTALNNTPSVRLLTSLGFKQTGTETVSFYKDDKGDPMTFEGGIFELILRG
ncbi:MAG: GNAT family N-acetyltransferase [Firmicutes bacterium]|nr:GNAT family N-acetyltransferase [Bacillota bacterium]MBQ6261111.1 GNAT family N-acetyltransferase [Bacillota bacterium]MBR0115553.1 GNAT family N-acetyltransferase [Bacillota bacterium]